MLRNYFSQLGGIIALMLLIANPSFSKTNPLESIDVSASTVAYSGCPGDTLDIMGILVNHDCGSFYEIEWTTSSAGPLHLWPTSSLSPSFEIQNEVRVYKLKVIENCTQNADSIEITVTPDVMAPVGTNRNLCVGESITLGEAPQTGVTYTWSPAFGLSSTSVANPTLTFPGNFAFPAITYTLTADNGAGCVVTDEIEVSFHQLPTVTFAADTVCEGTATTFTNQTANPSTIDTWQWSFGQGIAASTDFEPTFLYGSADSYTATLTAITANGCSASFTEEVLVPSMPTLNAAIKSDPTDCEANDGRIVINANVPFIVSPGIEYSIDGGMTWSFSSVFNGLDEGSYDVLVRNGGRCVTPTNQVTLTDPPAPSFVDVQKTNPTDCSMQDGSIQITATGGTGSLQYSIDGVTWVSTPNFNMLGQGSYPAMVRNDDGTCQINDGLVVLSEPAAPVITSVEKENPTNCGFADGTITIITTGGAMSHEYSINNGSTWFPTNEFNNLPAGTYEIMVRNADGTCLTTGGGAVLADPAKPKLNDLLLQNPSDCNLTDGRITIDASPGNGLPEYSINGGTSWVTSNLFINLAEGNYDIFMRNPDGTCIEDVGDARLDMPIAPVHDSTKVANPTDCDSNDGTITIHSSGGSGTSNYSIDGGMTFDPTGAFINLPPGNYDLILSNFDGTCVQNLDDVTLTAPTAPSNIAFTMSHPTLCNQTDGTITITADGTNLEYSIDNGMNWATSGAFTNLPEGTYEVLVRNNDGTCVTPGNTAQLVAPDNILIQDVTVAPVSSCGMTDGQIAISVSYGGASALEYSIDNGATWNANNIFTNLPSSTYPIAVRATNGTCEVTAPNATITSPIAPLVSQVAARQISDCNLTDGAIYIIENNPNPFEVSIDGGLNFSTQTVFTDLAAGNYPIQVRNLDGSCLTDLGVVELTQLLAPSITDVALTQPTSCGASDGQIVLTVQGVGGFEISIDNGTTWQTQRTFTGLQDGDYSIFIRNSDGTCLSTVREESLRSGSNSLSANVAVVKATCGVNDGAIIITPSGQTGTLEYSIDSGTSWAADSIFGSLSANVYGVMIRENGTCVTTIGYYEVGLLSAPEITTFNTINPTSCSNTDGQIEVFVNGDPTQFQYSINNGIAWQSGTIFPNLNAGNYHLMVRNADGSCAQNGGFAQLTVDNGTVVTNVYPTDALCGQTGFIEIEAYAPSGKIEYSIDGGFTWSDDELFVGVAAGNYLVWVRDSVTQCLTFADGVVIESSDSPVIDMVNTTNPSCNAADGTIEILLTQNLLGVTQYSINGGLNWFNSNTFGNLGAGSYDVTVRNMSSGVWCASGTQTVTLNSSSLPSVSISLASPSDCGLMDGRITFSAQGNPINLQYSIDGTNWQSSNVFENLTAGIYNPSVRLSDLSCRNDMPAVTLTAPASPSITQVDFTNPDCGAENGTITISATAGSGALEYSLNGIDWLTTGAFTDLPQGTYQILVRNDDGSCQTSDSNVTLTNPTEPIIDSVVETQPDCISGVGSITINANLGSDPANLLEYSVDDGVTWQSSNQFNNLSPATYRIVVRRTDQNACSNTGGFVALTVSDAPDILLVDLRPVSGCGTNDGRIEIFANGRSGQADNDIEYSIDGINWSRMAVYSNLSPGTYTPRVRFLDGTCEVSDSPVNIIGPEPPVRTSLVLDPPSCDGSTGSIQVTTTGNGTIQYSLDNGTNWFNGGVFSNLPAGSYTLTYRYDDGTCVTTDTTVSLNPTDGPMITGIATTPVTACDDSNGAITVTATGPQTVEYSLDVLNWQTSNTFSGLVSGTYNVYTRNADATCVTLSQMVDLTASETLEITAVNVFDITNCNAFDGRIEIVANGTSAIEYSLGGVDWQDSGTFMGLGAANYQPVARLKNFNCTVVEQPVTVSAPNTITYNQVVASNPTDCGVNDGMIQIQLAPGSGVVEYSIDDGATYSQTNIFQNLSAGSYRVAARRPDGTCITHYFDNPIILTDSEAPTASVQSIDPNCNMNDGQILVNATAGANPNNLPLEYSIDFMNWQASSTFTDLPEGSYTVYVRLQNTSCMVQESAILMDLDNCVDCNEVIFGDTMYVDLAATPNPICIPMYHPTNDFYNLTLDGNAVTNEGGCNPDSLYFYGYVPLVTLGGSDGPFELVTWEFNGNTFSGIYNTLDDLAADLNLWDANNPWYHESTTFALAGGGTGNNYGSMIIRHQRTGRSVSLQVNSFAIDKGTLLTVTGDGWHEAIATNPSDGCADTIHIHITPAPQVTSEVVDIFQTIPMNGRLEICNWTNYFTNAPTTLTSCGDPATGTLNLTTCVEYLPNADWVGYDNFCVVACRQDMGMTICDTANVFVTVTPPNDVINITLAPGEVLDTCLTDQLQAGLSTYAVSSCSSSTVNFTAQPGNEECIQLTAPDPFSGPTQVCVVHCDNGMGAQGPICDTTLINIGLDNPCTTQLFTTDTIHIDGSNNVGNVCLPIELLMLSQYDINLDGATYLGATTPCDIDSVSTYLYFQFPGFGNSGPYTVDWSINGNNFDGTVQDINTLVDSMNVWDPTGNWSAVSNIFTIMGNLNATAGDLTLTEIATGDNHTESSAKGITAKGTEIEINGAGAHQLVLTDRNDNCSNDVIIFLTNLSGPPRDTLRLTTQRDVDILNECLPTTDLPGMVANMTLCGNPVNGSVTLNMPCFDYAPNMGFVGNDEICIVLCDDSTPAVCDTTIVLITVEEPPMTCQIFDERNMTSTLDVCASMGAVCLPLSPLEIMNYSLTENGNALTAPFDGCGFDTSLIYIALGITPDMLTLDDWTVNGTSFSGSVMSLEALVDSMNVWDTAANWMFNPLTGNISGGSLTNQYGDLNITNGGAQSVLPLLKIPFATGSEIRLAPGMHQIIATDMTGCMDTLDIEVVCPMIDDIVIDTIINVGETITLCLGDYATQFDESYISTIMNGCTPNGNVDFTFSMMDNCLIINGLAVGMDTTCYTICLTDGTCFDWTINVNVRDECDNFIVPESSIIGVDCSQDSLFVCVRGFAGIITADYDLEIDGTPYGFDLQACGFDSTFSISYFTLPGNGAAGPYNITSWMINGEDFSGEFASINALVDSINRWDPTGNWSLSTAGVSIVGGNSRNTYGTIFAEQISTGFPATLELNTLIVPKGLGFWIKDLGTNELTFINENDGCRDTITVTTTCISTDNLTDTLMIGEFGDYCMPTFELVSGFAETVNLCPNASGDAVIFDWSATDTCFTYEATAVGTNQGCFIICDSLGVCDTTYISVTVLADSMNLITAVPDTARTTTDMITVINILGNDLNFNDLDSFFVITPPQHGTAVFLPDGTMQFTPEAGYCDSDNPDFLEYVICENGICDTTTVTILIDCETLRFFDGFSPNGDGINDTYIIQGAEAFPENILTIYNRWGNRVFRDEGYRNTWIGDWEGEDLPSGTYFYVFQDGLGNSFSGYLQINR